MKRSISDIFGLNKRNRDLVSTFNTPKATALANDKVACKKALRAHDIQTPYQIASLVFPAQVDEVFPLLEEQEHGFVVKPSHGSQGRAVSLFSGAKGGSLFPVHGKAMNQRDFRFLISSIISGAYTAGRPADCALVEERLKPSLS